MIPLFTIKKELKDSLCLHKKYSLSDCSIAGIVLSAKYMFEQDKYTCFYKACVIEGL